MDLSLSRKIHVNSRVGFKVKDSTVSWYCTRTMAETANRVEPHNLPGYVSASYKQAKGTTAATYGWGGHRPRREKGELLSAIGCCAVELWFELHFQKRLWAGGDSARTVLVDGALTNKELREDILA